MNVDSGYGHKQVNLLQYRRVDGRWQFIRVVRKNGKPDPRLVLIDGEPASSKDGHFYLAWREEGKLKREAIGSSPREALNAWHVKWESLPEMSNQSLNQRQPRARQSMLQSRSISAM